MTRSSASVAEAGIRADVESAAGVTVVTSEGGAVVGFGAVTGAAGVPDQG
jgi:hypothetical protein